MASLCASLEWEAAAETSILLIGLSDATNVATFPWNTMRKSCSMSDGEVCTRVCLWGGYGTLCWQERFGDVVLKLFAGSLGVSE